MGRDRTQSVANVIVRAALRGAERAGEAQVPEVLRATGLAPDALADPEGRLPIDLEELIWAELFRQTDDAARLAARAASQLEPGELDVVEYLARTSGSVRAALGVLEKHGRLLHMTELFDLRGPLFIYYAPHPADQPYAWLAAEFALGSTITMLRDAAAAEVPVVAADLRHPQWNGAERSKL